MLKFFKRKMGTKHWESPVCVQLGLHLHKKAAYILLHIYYAPFSISHNLNYQLIKTQDSCALFNWSDFILSVVQRRGLLAAANLSKPPQWAFKRRTSRASQNYLKAIKYVKLFSQYRMCRLTGRPVLTILTKDLHGEAKMAKQRKTERELCIF